MHGQGGRPGESELLEPGTQYGVQIRAYVIEFTKVRLGARMR